MKKNFNSKNSHLDFEKFQTNKKNPLLVQSNLSSFNILNKSPGIRNSLNSHDNCLNRSDFMNCDQFGEKSINDSRVYRPKSFSHLADNDVIRKSLSFINELSTFKKNMMFPLSNETNTDSVDSYNQYEVQITDGVDSLNKLKFTEKFKKTLLEIDSNKDIICGDVYEMDNELLDKPYFFNISKDEASGLMSTVKKKGSFLIRPSVNSEFVLMVLYEKKLAKKFKIEQSKNGWFIKYSNLSSKVFPTISLLVEFYLNTGINCGTFTVNLTEPVQK